MASQTSPTTITYGFELEFIVKMPRTEHTDLMERIRAEVAQKYAGRSEISIAAQQTAVGVQYPAHRTIVRRILEAYVPVHPIIGFTWQETLMGELPEGFYDKWRVDFEETCKKPADEEEWVYGPVEVVSKIYTAGSQADEDEVRRALRNIHPNSGLTLSIDPLHELGCHVHVGLRPPWDLDVLKRCALVVVGFEHLLNTLVPWDRLDPLSPLTSWLRTPSQLFHFLGHTVEQRLEAVRAVDSTDALRQRMTADDRCLAKQQGYDFVRCADDPNKTLEFRIFPAALEENEVVAYINVATGLVRAAHDGELVERLLADHVQDRNFDALGLLTELGIPKRTVAFFKRKGLHKENMDRPPWFRSPWSEG